jgi:5'-nucleotidase
VPKLLVAAAFLFFAFGAGPISLAQAQSVSVRVLAFNDFHGHLGGRGTNGELAGGVDYLAGYIDALRAGHSDTVVVSAGDLIGASPLVSGLFHDEPTIEAMNRLGLDLNAVGNHEFDEGADELLRMQRGGCHPGGVNTCKGRDVGTAYPFEGAQFGFLAANVRDRRSGETLFPAYAVRHFGGVPVAFIGMTLRATPRIVGFAGVRDLSFRSEARTVNDLVPQLRAQGIEAIVVLLHEGGLQSGGFNECAGISGPIVDIVKRLDDAVDLVVSGHTHQAYNCRLPNAAGRSIPVTSAGSYGRLLSAIDLRLDARSGDVIDVAVDTMEVRRDGGDIVPRAALTQLVARYEALAGRVLGQVTAAFTRETNEAGESALGRLIADAQLDATRVHGAQIALMNPGGLRANIAFRADGAEGDGNVTYAEAYAAQPFGNTLITMTLSGSQLKRVLERQFGCPSRRDRPRVLQVSAGFEYAWNPAGPRCAKVDAASIRLDGVVVQPESSYRVTVNSYLAEGGDGQWVLKDGTERVGGPLDRDALADYLARHSPLSPDGPPRIRLAP